MRELSSEEEAFKKLEEGDEIVYKDVYGLVHNKELIRDENIREGLDVRFCLDEYESLDFLVYDNGIRKKKGDKHGLTGGEKVKSLVNITQGYWWGGKKLAETIDS